MRIAILILGSLSLLSQAGEKSQADLQRQWQRGWHRPEAANSASLKITAVTNTGFEFTIEATAGANLGELTGKAAFEPYFLQAKGTVEKCQVKFALSHEEDPKTKMGPSEMNVSTEGDCSSFGGNGVDFDGKYLTEGVKPTFKAAFDCKYADTQVELTICADELLADGDRELNRLYAGLQSSDPFAKADVELKKEQMAWMKARNAACEKAQNRADCLVDRYATRLLELQAQTKKKKLEKTAVLFFDEYATPNIDESRDKLWKDPTARLVLRRSLGQETYDLLRKHTVYYAEESPKAGTPKEIAIFATIQGTSEKAGVVLTKEGHLWAALPTVVADKWQPLVFGPKDAKIPQPPSLKEWLSEAKTAGWKPPRFERVF